MSVWSSGFLFSNVAPSVWDRRNPGASAVNGPKRLKMAVNGQGTARVWDIQDPISYPEVDRLRPTLSVKYPFLRYKEWGSGPKWDANRKNL